MKKIFLIAFLLFSVTTFSQEPKLSHYWMDKIGQNPALVGDGVSLDFHFMNRFQWVGLNSKFNTYNFSADTYIAGGDHTGLGVGINLQQNQEGDGNLRTQKAEIAFSGWEIFKSHAEFSLGGCVGVIGKSITDNFAYSNQIDPVLGFIYPKPAFPIDTETGMKIYGKVGFLSKIYLGDDYNKSSSTSYLSNYILFGYSRSIGKPNLTFFNNTGYTLPTVDCIHANLNIRIGEGNGKSANWVLIQPYFLTHRSRYLDKSYFNSTTLGSRFISPIGQLFAGYRFDKINNVLEGLSNKYKRDALVIGFAFTPSYYANTKNRLSKGESKVSIHFSCDFNINGLISNNINATRPWPSFEGGIIVKLPTKWSLSRYSSRYQGHKRLVDCSAYSTY